ncbi:MAG: sensor histidine kinase, partial [Fusobacteriaceae bacterium]
MSSKKKRVSFFMKIFLFSSLIVIFTLFISYIANVAFIDQFYVYRKKNMMLEITESVKKYSIEKNEEELDQYIYRTRELEGIEIALDKKAMRMGNPMMMSHHMSMNSKIPLGEFSQKTLPGVGALILYYGDNL